MNLNAVFNFVFYYFHALRDKGHMQHSINYINLFTIFFKQAKLNMVLEFRIVFPLGVGSLSGRVHEGVS